MGQQKKSREAKKRKFKIYSFMGCKGHVYLLITNDVLIIAFAPVVYSIFKRSSLFVEYGEF